MCENRDELVILHYSVSETVTSVLSEATLLEITYLYSSVLFSLVVWTSWLWYFIPLFQCGWMWWYQWWIWGTTPHLLWTILKTSSPTAHKAGQYNVNSFLLCLMLSILHQTTCPIMFDRNYFLSVPPLGFVYINFFSLLCLLTDGPVQCTWSCINIGIAFQSVVWLL